MEVSDALKAMAAIDGQHDGSISRAVIVGSLHRKLIEDPENFWEQFFETLDVMNPTPTRLLAERLVRTGAANSETRIEGISTLVAWDAAAHSGVLDE